MWFFALLFPLIPIATIFPPGSLIVDQIPFNQTFDTKVPTIDVNYRGNGSASDLFKNAMFTMGPDGDYGSTALQYNHIGKQVLLGGRYLSGDSPCGANCTYDLSLRAPSLRCKDVPSITFPYYNGTVLGKYPTTNNQGGGRFNSQWAPDQANFMAVGGTSNKTFLGASSDRYFTFDLSFRNEIDLPLRNISCVYMGATYKMAVEFINGTQTVTVAIADEKPLNATKLGASSLFYDVMQSRASNGPINITKPGYNFQSQDDLQYVFQGTQMRVMLDVLLEPLGGAVSSFGPNEGDFTTNTIIKDTPFASSGTSGIKFYLSPSVLEDLMKNVTISFFNQASNLTNATIHTSPYAAGYVFIHPAQLVISYSVALAVSILFIAVGFAAMLHNGVSASTGGFLQIACTTTNGGSRMNRLAREACLGGEENLPKELLDLEVRFGEVDQQFRRIAAFGTEDETRRLLKGTKL